MRKLSVTILIPNQNGRMLLEKHLPSIVKVRGVQSIMVVDDHSEDDSVSYVSQNYPEITVLEKSGDKRGFSSTVNYGLQHVSSDLVALFNTDVVPEPDCLEKCLKYFNDSKLFAVGFLDRSHEKDSVRLRGRGVASWNDGFYRHGRGEVDKNDTAWVSGGSGIFRMSLMKKLGGFDELFDPFYWEDIDLSYRARKSGYRLVFASECQADHYHDAGLIKTRFSSREVQKIAFRNELFFHWKNITEPQIFLHHVLSLIILLVKSILTARIWILQAFLEAVWKFLEILNCKKRAKALFILSDREIITE